MTSAGRVGLLSSGLCHRVRGERGSFGHLRVVHPSLAHKVAPASPGATVSGFGLDLRMAGGRGQVLEGERTRLRSCSAELPFVDDAFGKVTLYHVISTGEEPEVAEACRVLAEGGDLLIVGLNARGWAGFGDGRVPELPRLSADRVRDRLASFEMTLESYMGAGLFGRDRPEWMQHGWRRLLLPVADIVLLHARHRIRAARIRPGLKKAPASLAPSALAGR